MTDLRETKCFDCGELIYSREFDDFMQLTLLMQAVLAHNAQTGHSYALEQRVEDGKIYNRLTVVEQKSGKKFVSQG